MNFKGHYVIGYDGGSFAEFSFNGFPKKKAIKPSLDKSNVLEWVSQLNRDYYLELEFDSKLGVLYRKNLEGSRNQNASVPPILQIPDGVRAIGRETFSGLSMLGGVVFPESLVEIGENAFRGCGLIEVTFGCSLVTIRSGAFADNSLSYVLLPPSLVNIGKGAFSGNSELKQALIYRTGLKVATVEDVQRLIQLRGDSDVVKRLAVTDALDGVCVDGLSHLVDVESAYKGTVLKRVPEQYRDENIRYLSEIASMELCDELELRQYNLTTAQVLASESEQDRQAWSKYTSKHGTNVAKKSEASMDTKREEVFQKLVLQNLEEKLGTNGSAETIAYLKSLLKTLEGAEE